VLARAPGSTSNLGPGFDVLGLALQLYVEVEVRPADSLRVHTSGEGADLPRDEGHLAVRVASAVLGHQRFEITVASEIPLGRGLGSSAALALAAAAAAGAEDPLSVAARSDGHAENAAASLRGGLVAASFLGEEVAAVPLRLDPELVFVVLIPDRQLETKAARAVLPATVAFSDAVFNLGRLGLLLGGLADARALLSAAGEDRIHQGARSALFPEAPELLEALRVGGARVATWSGAGPSLLGICVGEREAERTRQAGEVALRQRGVPGRAIVLASDTTGLTTVA
jgi:homoserine kinase